MTCPNGDGLPELLTISQAARACGEPERRLRHWVESGALPFRVVQPTGGGGRRYLRRSEVDTWARLWLGIAPDYSPLLAELT